jgi:hypothetical protein
VAQHCHGIISTKFLLIDTSASSLRTLGKGIRVPNGESIELSALFGGVPPRPQASKHAGAQQKIGYLRFWLS